ncbi:MAG TPA: glutaredoxin 3 [Agitococcus sp.]|nr:glutaredoxin 3 [Agitococcus sp.]
MTAVTVYSTGTCPWCVQAENLLKRVGATVEKIRVDQSESQLESMMTRSGRRTVPQIFVGDVHIGGFNDLVACEQSGELLKLINNSYHSSEPS